MAMRYGYHIWSRESLMQVQNDHDLHRGQMSNGVRYCKICSMAINLVRRSLMIVMSFIEVKGQQRSNVVIYVIWLPHLVRYR